jgi:hypothetical protein
VPDLEINILEIVNAGSAHHNIGVFHS